MTPTVFITGGAAGIGAATVRKFAGEGWNVLFSSTPMPEKHSKPSCPAPSSQRPTHAAANASKPWWLSE